MFNPPIFCSFSLALLRDGAKRVPPANYIFNHLFLWDIVISSQFTESLIYPGWLNFIHLGARHHSFLPEPSTCRLMERNKVVDIKQAEEYIAIMCLKIKERQ